MKKKILIICYDYSSITSPNYFRWKSIAKYWANKDYKIYVVSSWKPDFQREEVLNGVQVFRVGGRLIETIRNRIIKAHQPIKLNQIQRTNNLTIKQKLLLVLKWFHDRTWKKMYWPDYACLWFFPALKKANKLMKEQNIKQFISVSIPFTGHLVGNCLKRRYPNTNWIVDISDPFCFLKSMPTNNHLFYSKLNEIVEKRIFRTAQAISVLTKSTKEKYSELFPESTNKIFINPNLLSYIKNPETKVPLFIKGKKIRLIFVGMLNKKIRSPDDLLRIFQMILETRISDKMELHFFGGVENTLDQFSPYNHLINKCIFLHGIVGREKAIQAMHSADILVNIGNKNPYQEPSKVIEYASTGKPIINIMTIENDSSLLLLQKYPAVINILSRKVKKNSVQIADLVKFIEKPPLIEADFLKKWLAPFKIETIAKNYEFMLKNR